MTNAHYHRGTDTLLSHGGREWRFCGVHPWLAESMPDEESLRGAVRRAMDRIGDCDVAGIGEIGLDRLRTKAVTQHQRMLFSMQLEIAAERRCPVVLHGAKCWGEVVRAVKPFSGAIPSFLFHGFSRSDGLLPDIVALNGFVGVGKAVLNEHAVNYCRLVERLPADRLLIETDDDSADGERDALLAAIFAKVAELASITEAQLDENAARFIGARRANEP